MEDEKVPVGYAMIKNGEVAELIRGAHCPAGALPAYGAPPRVDTSCERLERRMTIDGDRVNIHYEKRLNVSATELRQVKIQQLKAEALKRIQQHYPAVTSLEMLELIADAAGPQNRNEKLAAVIAIAGKAREAIERIKAERDIAVIADFNPRREIAWDEL